MSWEYDKRLRETVHLEKHTEDEVYQAMVDALAKLAFQGGQKVQRAFRWDGICKATFVELGRRERDESVQAYEVLREEVVEHPDVVKLQAAISRLVSLGHALPRVRISQHVSGLLIIGLALTERGVQALQPVADGPHRAGYLHRMMKSQPMGQRPEAEEIFLRLPDAANCLEFDLYRPAIVMIGIAAEVTLFQAYAAMKNTLGLITGKHDEFAPRLEAVRKAQNQLQADADQKRRLSMALDMIESSRVMRNNAAHSGKPNPDPFLARERFGAACFHLPVVWEIVIVPNLPP